MRLDDLNLDLNLEWKYQSRTGLVKNHIIREHASKVVRQVAKKTASWGSIIQTNVDRNILFA